MTEFRQANQSLVSLAQRDLRQLWGALDLNRPERARDVLLEFFPDLVSTYGDTAAVLGADWYDQLRNLPPSAASFRAAVSLPVQTAQAEGSVRWAAADLFGETPDSALAKLLGSTQRLVLQPGRDSIWEAARADPVRTGIARVPSGPQTCRFCIMIASRGPVFASIAKAGGDGNTYHDDCDCVPTVVRTRDDFPEDYDLALYERLYAEGSGVGRDSVAA